MAVFVVAENRACGRRKKIFSTRIHLFGMPEEHVIRIQTLGRLRWSLWNGDAAPVFFNLHFVSKSPAEMSCTQSSTALTNTALSGMMKLNRPITAD